MKLTVREFGGIAGLRGHAKATVDTATLPQGAAAQLETQARELLGAARGSETVGNADRMVYDIVVEQEGSSAIIPPPNSASRSEFEILRRRIVDLAAASSARD